MAIKAPGMPWRVEVDVYKVGRTVEVEKVVEVPVIKEVVKEVEKRVEVESRASLERRRLLESELSRLEREYAKAQADLYRAQRDKKTEIITKTNTVKVIDKRIVVLLILLSFILFFIGLIL